MLPFSRVANFYAMVSRSYPVKQKFNIVTEKNL
jgi:hypothetical protein